MAHTSRLNAKHQNMSPVRPRGGIARAPSQSRDRQGQYLPTMMQTGQDKDVRPELISDGVTDCQVQKDAAAQTRIAELVDARRVVV